MRSPAYTRTRSPPKRVFENTFRILHPLNGPHHLMDGAWNGFRIQVWGEQCGGEKGTELDRLGYAVARPRLECLDGGFYAAIRDDDCNRHVVVMGLTVLDQLDAIAIGQFQIGQA
jgi:hypothetical protein